MAKVAVVCFCAIILVSAALEDHLNIINGKVARPGQFPYYAFLSVYNRRTPWECGATLIGDRWLVTAAHCLSGANQLVVTLGMTDRTKNTPRPIKRVVRRRYLYVHPDYDDVSLENDIGTFFFIIKNKNIQDSLKACCCRRFDSFAI